MAEQKFLVDINLNGQQLKQARLENVADASALIPVAADEGRVVYDMATDTVWYQDASKWIQVGGLLKAEGTFPIKVSTTAGVATISIDPAVATTNGEGNPDDPTKAGSMTGKDKEKLNKIDWGAQVDQNSDEVPHTVAANSDEGTSATDVKAALNNVGTKLQDHRLPTSDRPHLELKQADQLGGWNSAQPIKASGGSQIKFPSEAQIAAYVNGKISSSGRPIIPFEVLKATDALATGNLPLSYTTPYAPSSGTAGDIKVGDHFIIVDGGTIGTGAGAKVVKPNDSIIADIPMTADTPATQLIANWSVIKAATVLDADYPLGAGAATKGITRQSVSKDLVDTTFIDDILKFHNPASSPGDNTTFVTPLALQYYALKFHLLTEIVQAKLGSATSGSITHNWANSDVSVEAWITSSGERLIGQIGVLPGSVTITFNKAVNSPWTMMVRGEDKR